MFAIKLVGLCLGLYAILFFTGFGVSSLICRGGSRQYRYWLAPFIGILLFSILPIYFSILGINTSIAGWAVFVLASCYSVYWLIKTPPAPSRVEAHSLLLPLAMLPALLPAVLVILKTGYLTSTLESYSAFIAVPADYLTKGTFSQTVAVDYSRPVTNLLAEVIGNREYFGPFFLIAALSAIVGIPSYQLYLILSGLLAALIPVAAFIAGREAFDLQSKWALLLAFLVALNYSFFVWPMIGQMPMTGGMIYLVPVIGFMPSFFDRRAEADIVLHAALIAGVLSMYWILIPYVVGIYLLYGVIRFKSAPARFTPLLTGAKLAAGSLVINPFTLIFLCQHGFEMVATTSQFTKNVLRYPYLEELLGLGQHFSLTHDGSVLSILTSGVALLSLLFVVLGSCGRGSHEGCFSAAALAVFLILGGFFYGIDFTYHFYKNAVIATFMLLAALVAGVQRSMARAHSRLVNSLIIAYLCLFIGFNTITLLTFAWTDRRVIDDSLVSLAKLTNSVPPDDLILVDSHDPTEEAWISYFLRESRIKLRGSVEAWGFWILAPFSAKPNPWFFFNPARDKIDFTLTSKPLASTDIIHPDRRGLTTADSNYLLLEGLPTPYLFNGWYPPEKHGEVVSRWTGQQCELIIGESGKDLMLQITGEIPGFYDRPLSMEFRLNDEVVGRFESSPTQFTQTCLLPKDALQKRYNTFSIRLDRTFCPSLVMHSTDRRHLGIAVNSISLFSEETLPLTGLLDIGKPEYDKYLMSGWSLNEVMNDHTTYKWVTGKEASLAVFLQHPAEVRMEFRMLPFRYPGCPVQEATVYVNGSKLESIVLAEEGWSVHTAVVPAGLLKEGLNKIDFSFRTSASPSEVISNSEDRRNLSVAFDYVRFSPLPRSR